MYEQAYLKDHMQELESSSHSIVPQSKSEFHKDEFLIGFQWTIDKIIHTEKFDLKLVSMDISTLYMHNRSI